LEIPLKKILSDQIAAAGMITVRFIKMEMLRLLAQRVQDFALEISA
jgi:hypothetical protein